MHRHPPTILLLLTLHPLLSLSQSSYPNITTTSLCPFPITLHFPTPFTFTPIAPVVLSPDPPHNTSYTDYLMVEPSDGNMYVQISAGAQVNASTDRLEVSYSIAWNQFYYDVLLVGKGFGEGKVWLGASDETCPSVVVDEVGGRTWTGKNGSQAGGADCKTRPVDLLLKICV